jgi:dolichol kinase
MNAQLSIESQTIALELHALLQDLDPSRLSSSLYERVQKKFQDLHIRIEAVLEQATSNAQNFQLEQLRILLQELSEVLKSARETLPSTLLSSNEELQTDSKLRGHYLEFRKNLQGKYRQLSQQLDHLQIHVPSLRPTNYRRSIVHACGGLFGLFLVEFILTPTTMIIVASTFFTYAWTVEFVRRRYPKFNRRVMEFYGPIAHPHEHHRVNSATWYCSALLVISLTVTPMATAIALVVLGLADPFAALIGRRWGRTQLINGRSLEGSFAFFVMGFVASFCVITIWHTQQHVGYTILISACAALLGALGELFSGKIDDNFLTPLSTAAGVTLATSIIVYL